MCRHSKFHIVYTKMISCENNNLRQKLGKFGQNKNFNIIQYFLKNVLILTISLKYHTNTQKLNQQHSKIIFDLHFLELLHK